MRTINLPSGVAGNLTRVATLADLPTDVEAGAIRFVDAEGAAYVYDGAVWNPAGGGAGDISGPGSSTDRAVTRWDGTAGDALLDSVVVIDDTGNVSGVQDLEIANELSLTGLGAGVLHTDAGGVVYPDSVNLATEVTGVLPVANGGTNSSTALNGNRMMRSNAAGTAITEAPVITANKALISDNNGIVASATASATEVDYLVGVTSAIQTQLDAKIDESREGVPNGVATLDSGGKVPLAQLPAALMSYLGAWNASTNTPTLADGIGDAGDVYRVSVAGTQNLGSGAIVFYVGDWVIYSGTVWQRSPAADFSAFALTDLSNIAGTLPIANGGTGQTTANAALNALLPSQTGNANKALLTDGTNTTWTSVASTVTTTRGDMIRRGSSADERFAIGSANTVLRSDGTDPAWGQVVNEDISASAAIADTKLDTISTAGKVSGSAITSGTIGGSTAVSTSGNITSSGAFRSGGSGLLGAERFSAQEGGTGAIQSFRSKLPTPSAGTSYHLYGEDSSAMVCQIDHTGLATFKSGVKFKDTGAGSTTLSHYEEGTWTPVLSFSVSNASASISTTSATFTRIGSIVVLTGDISYTFNAGVSGELRFSGLPYTAGYIARAPVNQNLSGSVFVAEVIDSSNLIRFRNASDAVFGSSNGAAANNVRFIFTIVYRI